MRDLIDLIESKGGPDYYFHFTGSQALTSILSNNILRADNLRFSDKPKSISLTRSPTDAMILAETCIVLDGDKLRQRYKLIPQYGDNREFHNPEIDEWEPRREAEERLYKDVKPIIPYIKCVVLDSWCYLNLRVAKASIYGEKIGENGYLDGHEIFHLGGYVYFDLFNVLLKTAVPILVLNHKPVDFYEEWKDGIWLRKLANARPISILMNVHKVDSAQSFSGDNK